MKKFTPPEICPVCGEDVPRNAKACPGCGADERSGWRDDAALYDAIDLPDDNFDYDEFVASEFGGKRHLSRRVIWSLVAVLLLVLLLVIEAMRLW